MMYNFTNIFLIASAPNSNCISPKCNVVNVIMSTNKMLLAKLSGFVVIVDLISLDRGTHFRMT